MLFHYTEEEMEDHVHIALFMDTLASIGLADDVDRLFIQGFFGNV